MTSLESNDGQEEAKSTFHIEYEEEIQDIKGKKGLWPREWKSINHYLQSTNTSRLFSRARSRGMWL